MTGIVPSDNFPSDIDKIVRRIIAETKILSPALFQVADLPPEMVTSEVTQYPNQSSSDPLVSSLAWVLYLQYYARSLNPRILYDAGRDLLPELKAANQCSGGWDSGWKITAIDERGRFSLQRDRAGRSAFATQLNDLPTGQLHKIGDTVSLRRSKEDEISQPGYYYCIGDTFGDAYDDSVSSRIYLNVKAEAAPGWVRAVTQALNRYAIPFHFKILRYEGAYRRVDTAVIYLPRCRAVFAAGLIAGIAKDIGGLGKAHPFWSKRIAGGIGLADNPAGGQSLGLSRMTMIAEGLVRSWRRKETGAAVYRSVVLSFVEAGVPVKTPWLNPGNADYAGVMRVPALPATQETGSKNWLGVADRIGSRLVRDAIWHGRDCTWMGWDFISTPGRMKGRIVTLDGNLYSGTSGIALFLAQLFAFTRDEAQRETALAALRFAMKSVRREKGWAVGAYSGLSGILHVCLEVFRLTKDKSVLPYIKMLVEDISRARPASHDTDIISGRAGAIRVLLRVGNCAPALKAKSLKIARDYGHDLIELAEKSEGGWSWKTLGDKTHKNLLGYSHGTAGIASTLLELFAETRDKIFKDAADHAFRYEMHHFAHEVKNWPDWRNLKKEADAESGHGFMCAWCHGAPGGILALAHLQRHKGLSSDGHAIMSRAIDTLRAGTIVDETSNFCLCHGVGGNADIMLKVAELKGHKDLLAVAERLAQEGADRFHESGTWPCHVPECGQSLGLMTGLAGVGLFYLRMHDRAVPSSLEI